MDMSSVFALIQAFIPVLAPAATAAIKKAVPKVPTVLHPLVCVALGTVGAVVAGASAAHGVVLGAAGVAVREVVDQVAKLFLDEPKPAA